MRVIFNLLFLSMGRAVARVWGPPPPEVLQEAPKNSIWFYLLVLFCLLLWFYKWGCNDRPHSELTWTSAACSSSWSFLQHHHSGIKQEPPAPLPYTIPTLSACRETWSESDVSADHTRVLATSSLLCWDWIIWKRLIREIIHLNLPVHFCHS